MMSWRTTTTVLVVFTAGALAFAACTGSGTGSNAPCTVSTDCSGGEVCVRVGSESACTINCTGHVDECGAEASCEGVGSVGVNVCAEKKPDTSTPDPKEEPHLPCGSDAECSQLASGAVCAQWMSTKDCTILCSQDAECNPPAVGGVSTSFFGCKPDEANTSRSVCLPREECFNDPTSCITGLPNETTGTMSTSGSGFGGSF